MLKIGWLKYYCILCDFSEVLKKLPGIRKYVDPQNYASPDAALKDFALEIPSHQLRLDEVIGGGEIIKIQYFKKLMSSDEVQIITIKSILHF